MNIRRNLATAQAVASFGIRLHLFLPFKQLSGNIVLKALMVATIYQWPTYSRAKGQANKFSFLKEGLPSLKTACVVSTDNTSMLYP